MQTVIMLLSMATALSKHINISFGEILVKAEQALASELECHLKHC